MIDRHNFFDQPVRNDSITYNILKNGAGQGDDYTTGCLLDYNYFKRYYEMIVIDLSKQQLMLIQKQSNKLILLKLWIEEPVH